MKKTHLHFAPKMNGRNSNNRFAAYREDGETQAEKNAKLAKEKADKEAFEETIKDLPEDQKELMRTVKAQITEAFKLQDDAMREALTKALGELKDQDTIKAMATVLEQQGLAIRKMQENRPAANEEAPKTLRQAIFKQLEGQKDTIKEILEAGGIKRDQMLDLVVAKVAVNITETTTIIAGDYENSLTQDTGIISGIRHMAENYLSAVTTGTVGIHRVPCRLTAVGFIC
jgi:transposase